MRSINFLPMSSSTATIFEKLYNNYGNLQVQELTKYATDLTKLAQEGKLDPVIGRDKEIQRVMQILCKRNKNNACLIGDPGVGKTVIAKGLALRVASGAVPDQLSGVKIFALDLRKLNAGSSIFGGFEERFMKIVDEVTRSDGYIVLFIDELHTLLGGGGYSATDVSNVLKPALEDGLFSCIGATTLEQYKCHIEADAALKRRFIAVQISEPSVDEAIQMLKGIQEKYERFHGVSYADEAINACVILSKRYISEAFLPDKAIDLMDEAGSRAAQLMSHGNPKTTPKVTKADVSQLISSITGIPVEQICGDHDEESTKNMLDLEKTFSKHVIGQDEAIGAISRAIRRARVGLRDPSRPISTFLFTGPTGVGKTETAKVLAREYFGSAHGQDSNMVRLDMSEYKDSYSASRLYGAPPGYIGYDEGGQLTEAVRRKPHTLVLFDEIEKVHPNVFDALLQVLDDGRLTDGKGQTVDFKNTIIILTSNVAVDEDEVTKLKDTFRPEFLNRIDEIVVFKKLKDETLKQVSDVMLNKVQERIKTNNNVKVSVTPNFKDKLLQEGTTESYGARPLKRAISRLLEDPLAENILNGSIQKGDDVVVDVNSSSQVIIHGQDRKMPRSSSGRNTRQRKIATICID